MIPIEQVLSLLMGLSLSAACGFRIFVPLTLMSLCSQIGLFHLPTDLAWAANPMALSGLLVATVLELGTYYIPWLDNALDTIATPLAMFAGTFLMLGFAPQMDPFAQWALALIAGGGLAGTMQAATVAARGASTLTTGGLGNPIIATLEAILATMMAALALFLPVMALVLCVLLLLTMLRLLRKLKPKKAPEFPIQ